MSSTMTLVPLILAALLLWAQDLRPSEPGGPSLGRKEERQIQETREKRERMERDMAERLKRDNPQAYQDFQASLAQAQKVNGILERYSRQELGEEEAVKLLSPLIRAQMRPEIEDLAGRVKRVEKQLAFLKRAEKNPDLLVQRKIQQLLGKSVFEGSDAF